MRCTTIFLLMLTTLVHADAPATGPATFPNDSFTQNSNAKLFATSIDADTKHDGNAALLVNSSAADARQIRLVFRNLDPATYRGKRARYSAYVKTENVACAALGMICFADEGRVLANNDMNDRSLSGSNDWKKLELVMDVPQATQNIYLGINMHGSGKMWLDGAQVEVVDDKTPATDDRDWHTWSPLGTQYTASLDQNVQHDGHATMCLSSTDGESWGWYGHCDRTPDQYLGRNLHMTLWIKTENATKVMPNIRTKRADFQLVNEVRQADHPVPRTSDWQKYEVVAPIFPETQCIDSGVILLGRGKVWIDDVKYETTDTPASQPAK